MKTTFALIAATDITTFEALVNERIAAGWKFNMGNPVMITPHEDERGEGYQYSVPMLLEEQE